MKKEWAFLCVAAVFLLAGCSGSDTFKPEDLWVKISPLQCYQNPWEQAWLQEHRQQYPDDDALHTALAQQSESDIITSFYKQKGIEVKNVRIRKTAEVTCAGCNCSTGNTNFLAIHKRYLNKMKKEGYSEIAPDEKRIILIPDERYCLNDSGCHWVIINCCEGGRAFRSCYSLQTTVPCPETMKCEKNKMPSRKCACISNICEA